MRWKSWKSWFRPLKIRAAVLLAALLAAALVVAPASAHALFLRSNPAPNAVLARAPALVELFFSESLEPGLSSLSVLDSNAMAVDQGDVKVDPDDPSHMTVSLRSLLDGVYTVSWKALSATDGHLTSGSFPFAVGNADPAALAAAHPQQKQISLSPGEVVIQWLLVVCLALLAGGLPFKTLIWLPAQDTPSMGDPPIWKRLQPLGLLGLFILFGADLLVQAGQIAASGGLSGLAADAGRMLLDTRLGLIWLVRLFLALLFGWLSFSRPAPWKAWAAFGVTLLLLFSISLSSHAAADADPFLPILANGLHLVAISLWIGGLVYFVPAVRQVRQAGGVQQTHLTSLMIIRFSALALVCVGMTAATGIYMAALRIGSFPALWGTLYGQVLLTKLALVLPLLLLGAVNLLILSPRLKKDRQQAVDSRALVRRFGRMILAETVLGLLVLLSASLLSALPPAVTHDAATGQTRTLQVDDLQEELNITPGRVGLNTFTLKLQAGGQPLVLANEVTLRFSAIQQSLPPSEIQLVSQGDGVYQARGSYLSLPGSWQIQTIVRRANQFDAYANLNLTFEPAGSGSASLENAHIAGGMLLVVGLAFGLFMLALLPSRRRWLGWSGLPLAALLVFGLFFLSSPLPSNQGLVNPVAPNPASVSAGQTLFTSQCAACHGTSGKGDGPVGLAMRPRPADLTQHAVPGVHTDAQLFQWVSQGVSGTQMPAFQSILSETDRWNLVNFIRTLAPK